VKTKFTFQELADEQKCRDELRARDLTEIENLKKHNSLMRKTLIGLGVRRIKVWRTAWNGYSLVRQEVWQNVVVLLTLFLTLNCFSQVPDALIPKAPKLALPTLVKRHLPIEPPGSTWQDANCYPGKLVITRVQSTNANEVAITATPFIEPLPGDYITGAVGIYRSSDLMNWTLVEQRNDVNSLTVTDYNSGPFSYMAEADATGMAIGTNMYQYTAQMGDEYSIGWCQAKGIPVPPLPLIPLRPITNCGCSLLPPVAARIFGTETFR
jgi:hypothetical protein